MLTASPKPDNLYLCYRCQRCMWLITKLEMMEWRRADGGRGRGSVCPCGAGRISPTNPRGIVEKLSPRVLWLRLAVFCSPPADSLLQRILGPMLRSVLRVPTVLPPPPHMTAAEIEMANKLKQASQALDRHIDAVAERLVQEDIPLEEALVRTTDEEATR